MKRPLYQSLFLNVREEGGLFVFVCLYVPAHVYVSVCAQVFMRVHVFWSPVRPLVSSRGMQQSLEK